MRETDRQIDRERQRDRERHVVLRPFFAAGTGAPQYRSSLVCGACAVRVRCGAQVLWQSVSQSVVSQSIVRP